MAKKILVVDDEEDLLKLTAFRLKKSGYEVLTAVNGQEALDLIQNDRPDLILLDLRIPLISGYDVCKRVRADDKLKDTPIILFTASAEGITDKVNEVGANDYLTKPFYQEGLLGKVKKLIG